MAVIAPTPIDAGPAVPSSADSETTFDAAYEAFNAWEKNQLQPQANALASNVFNNAQEAVTAANTAITKAGEATTAASTATTKAGEASASAATASTKASEASTSASTANSAASTASSAAGTATTAAGTATTKAAEASASAAQAQVFATQQLKATSASNLVPGAGPKTFMVEPGRSFVKGMYLVATSTGAAVNQMSGSVDSYDGATGALALLVDAFTGTAARADWVIGVAASASTGLQSLHRGAYLREANGGTLVTNKRYGIWTGGGALAMNMPALADCAGGDEILLGNLDGTWAATNFTINCPANVRFINSANGEESTLVCNTNKVQGIRLLCTIKDASRARWAVMF